MLRLAFGFGFRVFGFSGFYKINQYAIADQTRFMYPWEMVVTT